MPGKGPTPSANRPEGGVSQHFLHENRKLIQSVERRGFLRGGLSLGAMTMLTGCDISNESNLQGVLRAMSQWNDRVQAWMFNPATLAPTYADADVLNPPRFNAHYSIDQVRPVNARDWRMELVGRMQNKQPIDIDALYAMPHETQITRHICVEGWDYIGKWSGVPLKLFLERAGAELTSKYVAFRSTDDYVSSIDMATALHPQTILATQYADKPLLLPFGFPMRLKTPLKLGFKQPKWIVSLEVTNDYRGGYWEDNGYNWFSGV
ncbi:MAG: molybdopterin-dependent oxidoreductase [Hyphomicrobiales bacterium]|nr:molybdopterin-dependent oxidoreductase [Hyphomicrobiales bacterium]